MSRKACKLLIAVTTGTVIAGTLLVALANQGRGSASLATERKPLATDITHEAQTVSDVQATDESGSLPIARAHRTVPGALAKSPSATHGASQSYIQRSLELSRQRPTVGETLHEVPADKPPKVTEVKDGDHYVQVEERTYKSAAKLAEMVFQDSSDGFVFPGSRIWTRPLAEGRFVPVPWTSNYPVVNAVLSGGSSAGRSPALKHDGTYLDFQRSLDPLARSIDLTAPRLSVDIGYGKSLSSALLNVGLSASGWGATLSAVVSSSGTDQRSFAVVSLSEVYYSVVANTPDAQGYFPPSMLDQDPTLGATVLGKLGEYGEVGYVRSVKYGRRLIIAVSAAGDETQLRRAVNLSASGLGVAFNGSIDDEVKKTWESMHAKAVVIGGKVTESLANCVTGGPTKFLENVNQYLKDTAVFDAKTGTVPVSFEVRYALDNEPMSNYETLEFSGPIVTKRSRAEETVRLTKDVELTGIDARGVHEDHEFDSDDWSKVAIAYKFNVTADGRGIDLDLTMDAFECEDDASYNNETHIQTHKVVRVFSLADDDRRKILNVESAANTNATEHMFQGELHHWFGFPGFGALRDISVHIDGGSGEDVPEQGLKAKVDFVVQVDRER